MEPPCSTQASCPRVPRDKDGEGNREHEEDARVLVGQREATDERREHRGRQRSPLEIDGDRQKDCC